MSEKIRTIPVLSIGLKTLTENNSGEKIYPFDAIVIEVQHDDQKVWTFIDAKLARNYARKMLEWADKLDEDRLNPPTRYVAAK